MIENGIVKLVQGNASVSAIATSGGGLFAEVPKDDLLPIWTYRVVSLSPDITLLSFKGLKKMRLEIDCYGSAAVDCVNLARAIDVVLNGFSGVLSDPDSTFVSSCFTSDEMDFFDEASRTYRRMIEYEIFFSQN